MTVNTSVDEEPIPDWIVKTVATAWANKTNVFQNVKIIHDCASKLDNSPSSNDMKLLAREFFRAATICFLPDQNMLECLILLLQSKHISHTDFITIIISYNGYRKVIGVTALCKLLSDELPSLQCSSSVPEIHKLVDVLFKLFSWIASGLSDTYSDVEFEVAEDCLIDLATRYLESPFVSRLLSLTAKKHTDEIETSILGVLKKISESSDVRSPEKYGALIDKVSSALEPLTVRREVSKLNSFKAQRSGIRTLTAIFSSFRVLETVDEVAETYLIFAQLHEIEHETVIKDILHAGLLILNEEQELRDSSRSLIQMFYFIKMPLVFAAMINKGLNREAIYAALFHALSLSGFKQIIDMVDNVYRTDTFRLLVTELEAAKVVTEEIAAQLIATRTDQMRLNVDLLHCKQERLLIQNTVENVQSVITMIGKLDPTKTEQGISRLINSSMQNDGHIVDVIGASCCKDGSITKLSSQLAKVNATSEAPNNIFPNRAFVFDSTFVILTRVISNFPQVALSDLMNGDEVKMKNDYTTAVFCRWSSKYAKRISKTPFVCDDTPLDPKVLSDYAEKVNCLKRGQIFWDSDTCDYGKLVESMPIIGKLILDEFKEKHRNIEEDLKKVLLCFFKVMKCLIICIVQWLDCQDSSEHRKSMARCIKESFDEVVFEIGDKETKATLIFLDMICRRQLDELCEGDTTNEPMTITLMSIAKRDFPRMRKTQVPELPMLKRAWLFAQRQNWASPCVLRVLDHCNQSGVHKLWVEYYSSHILKLSCSDVMDKAIEFTCACLLLDPIESLISTLEVLVDFLLDDEKAEKHLQFSPPFVIPIVKLVTQALLMSVWVIDRERKKIRAEPPRSKRPKLDKDADDENSESKKEKMLKLFDTTVDVALNIFQKVSARGTYHLTVTALCHIVECIVLSPDTVCKQMIIEKIPHQMLFQLSHLEPSMSVEMFSAFCDENDQKHEDNKLLFLCLQQSFGALSLNC